MVTWASTAVPGARSGNPKRHSATSVTASSTIAVEATAHNGYIRNRRLIQNPRTLPVRLSDAGTM